MPNAFPCLASGSVTMPPMVVWEIARLVALGKLPSLPGGVSAVLRQQGFGFLPMTPEVAEAAEALPRIHRDPIDRISVAHAMAHDMPILISDTVIPQYGAPTI